MTTHSPDFSIPAAANFHNLTDKEFLHWLHLTYPAIAERVEKLADLKIIYAEKPEAQPTINTGRNSCYVLYNSNWDVVAVTREHSTMETHNEERGRGFSEEVPMI